MIPKRSRTNLGAARFFVGLFGRSRAIHNAAPRQALRMHGRPEPSHHMRQLGTVLAVSAVGSFRPAGDIILASGTLVGKMSPSGNKAWPPTMVRAG